MNPTIWERISRPRYSRQYRQAVVAVADEDRLAAAAERAYRANWRLLGGI